MILIFFVQFYVEKKIYMTPKRILELEVCLTLDDWSCITSIVEETSWFKEQDPPYCTMMSGLDIFSTVKKRYHMNVGPRSNTVKKQPMGPEVSEIAKKTCVNRTCDEATLPGEERIEQINKFTNLPDNLDRPAHMCQTPRIY